MDFFQATAHAPAMKPKDSCTQMVSRRIGGGRWILVMVAVLIGAGADELRSQPANPTPVIQIRADHVTAAVSPTLYGLMTEEINYSYDGGLYGELIRNRNFKDNPTNAVRWELVQAEGANGSMCLDPTNPLNEALGVSLKLDVTKATPGRRVGIANAGFWGVPVRPRTQYHASFYARSGKGLKGPLTVAIVNSTNTTTYASAQVRRVADRWQRYEVTLTTGRTEPTRDGRLVISAGNPGVVWFSMVSLFPPTWHDRPNGNRMDIMQLLAEMKPAFLRFPGGNYLEGNTIATRFDWKQTLGPISQRAGHPDDAWGYRSSDGMGLLEFLEWCEDLQMQPVLAVYAGYSLKGQHVAPGPDLEPYVKDALDEIEYVTGNAGTTWGARRAKDGHPAAFPMKYVEIGNEDWFDRSGSYNDRFVQFYDAIKAKYPSLQLIATTKVNGRTPDVLDDHFYRNSLQMQSDTHHYDRTDRSGPKIFVGEWATREGSPTPNMNAALGDAAWMTGMERNSDLVIMSCYAPLFVNVNPGGMQWRTDLIGYNALSSYGSPAYYAQKMFSLHHGDQVLEAASENLPTREWQPPARRRSGESEAQAPPKQRVPTLFFDATRDSRAGTIYLKLVNSASAVQPVHVQISGLKAIATSGDAAVMSAGSPDDTNSITEPAKIVPVATKVSGLGTDFTRDLPAYSITILALQEK
jgi:alpha-L-arabinofuranosidase